MSSLKSLKASSNDISSVPFSLGLLSDTLDDLDLSNNPLPQELFAELGNGTKPFLKFLKQKLGEDIFLQRYISIFCPIPFS